MRKTIHTVESLSLRELLIEYRTACHYSQRELAKILNWKQSYLSKIETGERRIDFIEFLAIAKVLQIDIKIFLDQLEDRIQKNLELHPDKPTIL